MGITGVIIWLIGVINLLTKSPLTLQVDPFPQLAGSFSTWKPPRSGGRYGQHHKTYNKGLGFRVLRNLVEVTITRKAYYVLHTHITVTKLRGPLTQDRKRDENLKALNQSLSTQP